MDLITSYPPDPGPVGAPGHYTDHDWAGASLATLQAGLSAYECVEVAYSAKVRAYGSGFGGVQVARMGHVVWHTGLSYVLDNLAAGETAWTIPVRFCPAADGAGNQTLILTCMAGGVGQIQRLDLIIADGRVIAPQPIALGTFLGPAACWGLP